MLILLLVLLHGAELNLRKKCKQKLWYGFLYQDIFLPLRLQSSHLEQFTTYSRQSFMITVESKEVFWSVAMSCRNSHIAYIINVSKIPKLYGALVLVLLFRFSLLFKML